STRPRTTSSRRCKDFGSCKETTYRLNPSMDASRARCSACTWSAAAPNSGSTTPRSVLACRRPWSGRTKRRRPGNARPRPGGRPRPRTNDCARNSPRCDGASPIGRELSASAGPDEPGGGAFGGGGDVAEQVLDDLVGAGPLGLGVE